MKNFARNIAFLLGGALVVLLLAWAWKISDGIFSSDQSQNVQTQPPATPSQGVAGKGCDNQKADLSVRATCFVEAWYLLKPDDDTESVKKRLRPYLHEAFTGLEDVVVYKDSSADKARIAQKLTIRALVSSGVVAEPFDAADPNDLMIVGIPAEIWLYTSTGEPSTLTTSITVSTSWQLVDGIWRVITIEEVGDVG